MLHDSLERERERLLERAVISQDSLEALRSRIVMERLAKPWNEYATLDAIWHFAEAMGDDNPLWRDLDYAAKTRWGTIIAPPTYLHSCCSASGGGGHGLPGIFGLWAHDVWDWWRPVHMNDRVNSTTHLAAVLETPVWSGRKSKENYAALLDPYGVHADDPTAWLQNILHPGITFKDADLQEWGQQQARTLDLEERKKLVHKIALRLLELEPAGPSLRSGLYTMGIWDKVENYPEPIGLWNSHKYAEVWLAGWLNN
ncbi:MAG: MaoC family dehydratase N-terminal domain-containing protein [Chloroflexota bacterium]